MGRPSARVSAARGRTNRGSGRRDGIHFTRAAKVNRIHTAAGPYDPDAHANVRYGRGIIWGVAQVISKGRMAILRFGVTLKASDPPGAGASATSAASLR